MSTAPEFTVVESLAGIAPAAWNSLAGGQPLLAHAFLHALHETRCACEDTGWGPRYIVGHAAGELVAAMPLYLKTHSYGEYVFDWSWADAYRRHGRRYYPKLLAAIPFTPATGPRLLVRDPAQRAALWREAIALARRLRVSSLHVLFPDPAEAAALAAPGILHRHGIQFRWENQAHPDFAGFLATFSHDKRKKIRQDRARVRNAGVTFRWLDGRSATAADWRFFFRCYANHYPAHRSSPYL
ncbi:MAG: N-acetyltransferase, partial [Burkholderiales bacterium]|nr:N-acetyltransferase [Burkholderiales bacterium]